MAKCSWKIEENKKSSSDGFLKVKPGCKLMIRLIEDPVKFFNIFSIDRRCAVIVSEDTGRRLKERYPRKLSNVKARYTCWCIDRVDCSMKILDMPVSVAISLRNRQVILGKVIAGITEGCDFAITTNGKTGKDVKYEAIYIEETPLTQAEQEMVKEKMADKDSFDLTKVFTSCSYKEAEEKLLGGVSYEKVIA